MAKRNILHVSDLHFGAEPYGNIKTSALQSRETILNNLIVGIKAVPDEWKPDIIAVSGDIGWKAHEHDYQKASKWFGRLSSELCLPREKFIFCPGNHDIDRKEANRSRKIENIEHSKEFLSLEEISYRSDHFKNFALFCQDFNASPLINSALANNDVSGFIKYLYGYREICGIHFVVLNSAWCCVGNEDLGKLWIGENLVLDVQQCIPSNNDNTIITLFHHPLSNTNIVEQRGYSDNKPVSQHSILKLSDMILNGHVHGNIRKGTCIEGEAYVLTTGATYQPDSYSLACQIIRVDTSNNLYSTRILKLDENREWTNQEGEVNIAFKKK